MKNLKYTVKLKSGFDLDITETGESIFGDMDLSKLQNEWQSRDEQPILLKFSQALAELVEMGFVNSSIVQSGGWYGENHDLTLQVLKSKNI